MAVAHRGENGYPLSGEGLAIKSHSGADGFGLVHLNGHSAHLAFSTRLHTSIEPSTHQSEDRIEQLPHASPTSGAGQCRLLRRCGRPGTFGNGWLWSRSDPFTHAKEPTMDTNCGIRFATLALLLAIRPLNTAVADDRPAPRRIGRTLASWKSAGRT